MSDLLDFIKSMPVFLMGSILVIISIGLTILVLYSMLLITFKLTLLSIAFITEKVIGKYEKE